MTLIRVEYRCSCCYEGIGETQESVGCMMMKTVGVCAGGDFEDGGGLCRRRRRRRWWFVADETAETAEVCAGASQISLTRC
ncbi:hypothetical protein Hanom_Chr08g00715561 [Helianthus anomalus]